MRRIFLFSFVFFLLLISGNLASNPKNKKSHIHDLKIKTKIAKQNNASSLLSDVSTKLPKASQSEIDAALFSVEEFFGQQSKVSIPYQEARKKLEPLLLKYPHDPQLLLHATTLDEKLGNFDKSIEEMQQYVLSCNDQSNALRRLASFYHRRAMYSDEVKVLEKLVTIVPVQEQESIYTEVPRLIQNYDLTDFDLIQFYKQAISNNPDRVKIVKTYIEYLISNKKYSEALKTLDEFQSNYPDNLQYFLKTKSTIYESEGNRLKAEEVYNSSFDPLWSLSIVSDYYEMLRRFGRYRTYKRELQNKFLQQNSNDFNIATRLFNIYAYEVNFQQASSIITELENRRGKLSQPSWTTKELKISSGLCLQIGNYDNAARFLYSLYLSNGLSEGTTEREKTLVDLTNLLLDVNNSGLSLSAVDISFYKDVASIDSGAGFFNGLLSLILSGNNFNSEFEELTARSSVYFNRLLAFRFYNTLKTEFPSSSELSPLIVRLLDSFTAIGEAETVIEIGDSFLKQSPNAKNYDEIVIKIADAEVRLKRTNNERTRLLDLLNRKGKEFLGKTLLVPVSSKRWKYKQDFSEDENNSYTIDELTNENSDNVDEFETDNNWNTDYIGNTVEPVKRITYSSILERIISSFATEEKNDEILKFLYGEIKKHPHEEGLYERLLKWLDQTSMLDEQLKVYTQAAHQFNSNTWYHRLARWFVRNKREEAFEKYSKEIIETLNDEDIEEYLHEFVSSADFSSNNHEDKLCLELYRFAHFKFPSNPTFVKELLKYYKKNTLWKDWESLSLTYFFVDSKIRAEYLEYLAKNNKLHDHYELAQKKSSANYNYFVADASMWLSHHEKAVEAYRELIQKYPGEPQYAEPLAQVARSLGSSNSEFYKESIKAWSDLANIYPSNHEYRTQAGEVYAEMADFKEAGNQWEKILTSEKGNPETYLEVASIYWDYFQYEDAIRILKEFRTKSKNPTAQAYQLGAIYEGQNKISEAISEYISVLAKPDDTKDKVIKRLKQLSLRKDYSKKITEAYETHKGLLKNGQDTELILGYVEYLKKIGQSLEANKLLEKEVSLHNDVVFLESARDEFQQERLIDSERYTLQRLIQVARDEHETIMYRLQLASFDEQLQQVDKAVSIIDQLVTDFPTNLGVIQESAKFYWRVGLLDKSLSLYQKTADKAVGDYKHQFAISLAKHQIEANKMVEAEKTLRTYYIDNPLDTEAFQLLTQVLGETGQQDALMILYREAISKVLKQDLESSEKTTAIANLRQGLIKTFILLKHYDEGIDQYIEIINRQPDDLHLLSLAIQYAQKYEKLDRLTSYYEQLVTKADRNYHWNVILGEIYTFRGNLSGAAEQYKFAVLNEPQRFDFRATLADLYSKSGKFDEAVATLKRVYELDSSNPEWLVRLAKLYLQKENGVTQAVAVLRQALSEHKKILSTNYFKYGHLLLDAGVTKDAAGFYEDGISAIQKDPYHNSLTSIDIESWANSVARTQSLLIAFTKLENLRETLNKEALAVNNSRAEIPRTMVTTIESVINQKFSLIIQNYGTPEKVIELETSLRQRLNKINTSTTESLQNCNQSAQLGQNLGLFGLQESALIKGKDIAFDLSKTNKDKYFSEAMNKLLTFYNSHNAFNQQIQLLLVEEKREKFPEMFSYLSSLAEVCRKTGNTSQELEALRRFYHKQSGNLVVSDNALVKRYLFLLYKEKNYSELESLAQVYSPFQLQLVNFLIAYKEKDLARKGIQHANLSPAWIKSRSAELELYFRNSGPEAGFLFEQVLDIHPIGVQLNSKSDKNTELIGRDWYLAAHNYGIWLTLDKENSSNIFKADKYLVAETELSSNSSEFQVNLASFYLSKKQHDKAFASIKLAQELEPNSLSALDVEGSIFSDIGNKSEALRSWDKMVSFPKTSMETYSDYINILSEHDLLIERFPEIEKYFIRKFSNPNIDFYDFKSLIQTFCNAVKLNPKTSDQAILSLVRVTKSIPDDVGAFCFGWIVLDTKTFSPIQEFNLYKVLSERISNNILIEQNSNFDNYLDELGNFTKVEALNRIQQAWLDKLIGEKLYTEAQKEIYTILKTRKLIAQQFDVTENIDSLEDTDSNRFEGEPEWLIMVQAVLDLRTNHADEAIKKLNRFITLSKKFEDQTNATSYLHAYALLTNENHLAEADALLGEYYTEHIGILDSASVYAGLAGIEFRRGRQEAALLYLNKLVSQSDENLILAAKIATQYKSFTEAIKWRSRAAQLFPQNINNRIELARLSEANGNLQNSFSAITGVIDDPNITNQQLFIAFEVFGEIVRHHKNEANIVIDQFKNRKDISAQVVLALSYEANGDLGKAEMLLNQAAEVPYSTIAKIQRAQLAEREKQIDVAISFFEKALFEDPSGNLASLDGFPSAQPAVALVRLHLQSNQFESAIRLASSLTKDYKNTNKNNDENNDRDVFVNINYLTPKNIELSSSYLTLDTLGMVRSLENIDKMCLSLADASYKLEDLNKALEFAKVARLVAILVGNIDHVSAADQKIAFLIYEQNRSNSAKLKITNAYTSESFFTDVMENTLVSD